MIRATVLSLVLTVASLFGGTVQQFASLPNAAVVYAVQVDRSGNVYAAGSLTPQNPKASTDGSDAFVAKLSPDGSRVLYLTTIGGSRTTWLMPWRLTPAGRLI
jgi:hypothetical protein